MSIVRSLRSWLRGIPGIALLVAGTLMGVLIGLALFTFGYAGGFNYFGNNPATCNQCHAMNEEYNSWLSGPHHHAATCNDCHSPHDNVVHKYVSKADNGFWHGLKFTTGDYPENIKIREVNREITQNACLYCHSDMVGDMSVTRVSATTVGSHPGTIDCLHCHSNVGHLR